ncbi:MAG: tyrosine--tRNA ligase [Alphaproteobacteria bacterium]
MPKYKSEFLNILDQRGFIYQCSNAAALDEKLAEGPQSAYVGYDATATSLHVGNLLSIMMLYWFHQTGHKPITLMGGGTSKVGDPSFRDEARKLLDDASIAKNISGIQDVFAKFLKYGSGKTDALMVNNNDWLGKLGYLDFLRDYGTHFTINRMLSFDSVKLRLERESPLTFLEFNYMIMQGYDFVELHRRHGTILQMGGSDQWGNIINGVDLGHRKERAQLFALTCPLLATSSGAKMGKTADGAVWLNADMLSPYDYYQYWRNTEDADVGRFLKFFTILPMAEIARLEKLQGQEINEAKKILAFEATKLCHGEKAAREAGDTARHVFEQGGVGDDLPSIEIDRKRLLSALVVDLFVETGLAASKSEARRLISQGGAKLNDRKIDLPEQKPLESDFTNGHIKLSAGKKKHALVRLQG